MTCKCNYSKDCAQSGLSLSCVILLPKRHTHKPACWRMKSLPRQQADLKWDAAPIVKPTPKPPAYSYTRISKNTIRRTKI